MPGTRLPSPAAQRDGLSAAIAAIDAQLSAGVSELGDEMDNLLDQRLDYSRALSELEAEAATDV